jgi:bacterioferritin-associated ferredoxin
VEEAIDAGAHCPESVLAFHGCERCCGQCLPEIADSIGMACGRARSEVLVAAE